MPEILVENEPWLGLVVLADGTKNVGAPGSYVLAPAAEWYSKSRTVTAWRGPGYGDEQLDRYRLQEMECRTVLVEDGYYTCPPIIDELKDLVKQESEKFLDEKANERYAESISYVEEENAKEKYGTDEVYVISTCGDAVAVNGELVHGRRPRLPRNYEKTEDGGYDPSGGEEEIDKDHIAEVLAYELSDKLKRTVSQEDVRKLIDKFHGSQSDYMMWGTSSADTDVYVSRKALRKWEKEEEARRQRRREEEQRRRTEEHNRRMEAERLERERLREEHRSRIKKGGWPSPKDWSPKGKLPGEEDR